jgi:copper homeostasis protein (lipoprotein)
VATAALAACSGVRTGRPAAATPGVESFPGPLPASFSGELPCADCPGVRHTIELHAGNVFVYRMTYLGRGEGGKGESFDDLGRWTISPDGRTLTLRGGREAPVMFAIEDGRTLRKLDLEGRPIASPLNDELVRAALFEPLEPQLFLRGMYSYMADAGLFVDCATGWRLPVAMEADNVALERGYLAVRKQPGEPVLVSLEGRIAMRPRMEGPGLQRSLVPVRFNKAWPGQTCASTGGATDMPSGRSTTARSAASGTSPASSVACGSSRTRRPTCRRMPPRRTGSWTSRWGSVW